MRPRTAASRVVDGGVPESGPAPSPKHVRSAERGRAPALECADHLAVDAGVGQEREVRDATVLDETGPAVEARRRSRDDPVGGAEDRGVPGLSLIHISEPT